MDLYSHGVKDAIFRTFECLARMPHQVRIPRLYLSSVKNHAKFGLLTFQEAMKGHRKMRLYAISELDHVGRGEAIGYDAIELLP